MSTAKTQDASNHEDAVLSKLGYQQELKRSFGLLGMIGFSFSIVTSWTALGSVLIIGVQSGGPPVMIYSWIGICVFTLAVAYSLAEICSAFPTNGGQYSWVAMLAPPRIARGMSWMTGWFMITGEDSLLTVTMYVYAIIRGLTWVYRDSCNGSDQQLHRCQFHPGSS